MCTWACSGIHEAVSVRAAAGDPVQQHSICATSGHEDLDVCGRQQLLLLLLRFHPDLRITISRFGTEPSLFAQ